MVTQNRGNFFNDILSAIAGTGFPIPSTINPLATTQNVLNLALPVLERLQRETVDPLSGAALGIFGPAIQLLPNRAAANIPVPLQSEGARQASADARATLFARLGQIRDDPRGLLPFGPGRGEFRKQLGEATQQLGIVDQVAIGLPLDIATAGLAGSATKLGLKGAASARRGLATAGRPFATTGEPSAVPAADKLADLLDSATRRVTEVEPLRTAELGRRAGRFGGILERGRTAGRETQISAREALGALRGRLPAPQVIDPIAREVPVADIAGGTARAFRPVDEEAFTLLDLQSMFDTIGNPPTRIGRLDQANAFSAFFDLLEGKAIQRNQIALLAKIFGDNFGGALTRLRPQSESVRAGIMEVLGLPRSMLASFDMSAPMRQGWFLAPQFPKEWASSFVTGAKVAFSPRRFDDLETTLQASPTFQRNVGAGLFHAKSAPGTAIAERPEEFISGLAGKIPGFGKQVRASERAFTGFSNKFRQDSMNSAVRLLERESIPLTPDELQRVAAFINHATGRGTVRGGPGFDEAFSILGTPFFSLRYQLSRVQVVGDVAQSMWHVASRVPKGSELDKFAEQAVLDRRVSKLIAGSAIRWVSLNALLLSAAAAAGAKVSLDRESSEFGKLKIGNTRLDPWTGFQSHARFISQFMDMARTSTQTGEQSIPTEREQTMIRFVTNKFAPTYALFYDTFVSGEDFQGNSSPRVNDVWDRLAPIFAQDLLEAAQEEGITGAPLVIPAFFGVGFQAFPTRTSISQELFGKPFTDLLPVKKTEAPPKIRTSMNRARKLQRDRVDEVLEERQSGRGPFGRFGDIGPDIGREEREAVPPQPVRPRTTQADIDRFLQTIEQFQRSIGQ